MTKIKFYICSRSRELVRHYLGPRYSSTSVQGIGGWFIIIIVQVVTKNCLSNLVGIRGHTVLTTEDNVTFNIDRSIYKQSRPHWNPGLVIIKTFSENNLICPYHTLREYLLRTVNILGTHKFLFITIKGKHHPISRATLRRWLIEVLQKVGLDISRYGSGSTRAAATSKAFAECAPLDMILSAGGWTSHPLFSDFTRDQSGEEFWHIL